MTERLRTVSDTLENLVESDNDEHFGANRLIDVPLLHQLPGEFSQDLTMIEQILLEYGAKKIILYGSLARDDYHADSDIDICVQGLPNKNYFPALAECLMKTTHRMSILDFKNTHGYFRERIIREGRLIAMSLEALQEEVAFGLENLEKIYQNIINFSVQPDINQDLIAAALTYECFGYYNAIEHLMLRFLKALKVRLPAGQFSHRDTLRTFFELTNDRGFKADDGIVTTIMNLMAFRHVATKIYSFLIDWDKLTIVVDDIKQNHQAIKQLFTEFLTAIVNPGEQNAL